MSKRRKQVYDNVSLGWNLITLSPMWLLFAVVGWFWPSWTTLPPWLNALAGVAGMAWGISLVLRYRPALLDDEELRRLDIIERDERVNLMKLKASRRAYAAMIAVCAVGLLWTAMGSAFGIRSTAAMPWLWSAALLIPLGVYHLSYHAESREVWSLDAGQGEGGR
jgi:hypothetical protein